MSDSKQKNGNWFMRHKILTGIAAFVVFVILVGSMGGDESSPTPPNETTNSDQQIIESMSAVEQMEIAFIGNPRQDEIKEKLDTALTLYNTEVTEENYSRAGSALVALRKESKKGVTEMEILDYMINSHVEGVNMGFPEMAAISASALETGMN